MMEQDLKQVDLVPYFGSRSRVSEFLSRQRPLTVSVIRGTILKALEFLQTFFYKNLFGLSQPLKVQIWNGTGRNFLSKKCCRVDGFIQRRLEPSRTRLRKQYVPLLNKLLVELKLVF